MNGDLPNNINDVLTILGYAIEGEPLPNPPLYCCLPNYKFVHYIPSGHAPVSTECKYFMDLDEVKAAGLTPCSLCINTLLRLPMMGAEIALGKEVEATIRHNHRFANAPELQENLRRVGKLVLSNWPTKLKGYDYRFAVLEDSEFNACSCPGGFIFVNRGLLENVEGQDELEAVLAHEIAHVEQRHGLMEYLKAQRNNGNAMLIASVVTAGLAVGGSASGNNDAIMIASAGGQISLLLANIAANVASAGYSKEHEQEADIYALIYLQNRKKPKSALISMLKKVRTSEDISDSISGESTTSRTHPETSERLQIAETLEVQSFGDTMSFDSYEKGGELLYNLRLNAQANFKRRDGRHSTIVLGELSTTASIGESEKFTQLIMSQGKNVRTLTTDGINKIGALETLAVSFSRTDRTPRFLETDFVPTIQGIPASKTVKHSFSN